MSRTLRNAAASLLTLGLTMATLAVAHAADLKVIAGGGITAPLNEIVQQFERSSGHKVVVQYATAPELAKIAAAGTPFDVAVVPREVFADSAALARFGSNVPLDVARVGFC